jgi:GNAT superfamily N-acetyltransferase
MKVESLHAGQADAAVAVLCNAFYDYPVMRYVLGDEGNEYDRRLTTLVGLFVAARIHREEPLLGIRDRSGALAGVAVVTLPGQRPSPEALNRKREAVWQELGAAERARYDRFSSSGAEFVVEAPHHHLNMIGVRRSHAGCGLGRVLLEAVHTLSSSDPESSGVSLSTEDSRNLPLYQKFGYRLLGHSRVSDTLESWSFFRPTPR